MTMQPTGTGSSGLVDRVKNILLTPQAEWDKIAAEPFDLNKLYMGYVLPLAALSAICAFIGMSIFGISGFGITYRTPIVTGVVGAVLQVAMGLGLVYAMALITNSLATNFSSTPDPNQAHRLSAYGATAYFVGGIFSIFPPLSPLGVLVSLYSAVLIFLGLPRLMKTPDDKRIGYFAVLVVLGVVVAIGMGVVLGSVSAATGMGMRFG